MIEWRVWKKPGRKSFRSGKKYADYLERCRCAVCHQKLENGEEWALQPIFSMEESGSRNVQAVILHRRCSAVEGYPEKEVEK